MKRVPFTLLLLALFSLSLFAQGPVIGGPTVGIGTVGVDSTQNQTMPAILAPTVSGGTAPYQWSVIGTPLPAGLVIEFSGGRIYGTPQASTLSGGVAITLQVKDNAGLTATRGVTIIIRDQLTVGPLNGLPLAALNVPYSQCLEAFGGAVALSTPIVYTVTEGQLPPGITLASAACGTYNNSARLQGTPTQGGNYLFKVKAVDSESRESQPRQFSISVGVTPTLMLTNTTLDFFCLIGTNCNTVQNATVTISSLPSNGFPVFYTTTVSQPWLTVVGLDQTTTPARLSISVNPSAVTTAGISTATVQISSSTGVAAVLLTVRLNTTSTQGSFSSDPSIVVFNTPFGGQPAPQIVKVRSTGVDGIYDLTATTGWLVLNQNKVAIISGQGDFSVQANPNGLAAGTYNSQINVSSQGSLLFSIPVTFNIGTGQLVLSNTALTFSYQNGVSPANQQQIVTVQSSSAAGVSFTASASTNTPGFNWLSVSPLLGTTPGTLSVSLTNNLPPAGTYTGTVTVSSGNAASQFIIVTLTVTGNPSIVSSPTSLTFTQQVGSTQPNTQALSLTSSGSSNFNFTAGTTTQDNGNWLQLSQTFGVTPASLQVSMNASSLPVGVYNGRIVINATESANSQLVIPVTLTVTQIGSLGATPTSLSFSYILGGDLPPGQQLLVASATTANFTITPSSSTGWLRVGQSSGTTPASITISVSPADLSPGTYTGSLSVQSPTAGQATVPVTLTVTSANAIRVSPASLVFTHRQGSTPPPSQILKVSSSVSAQFSAAARVSSGSWLSVAPVTANTPADVIVSVDPSALGIGDYTGTVVLTPADGSPAINVPVSLSVLVQSKPLIRSFTNGASFFVSDASPGMIFTVFGAGVGSDPLTGVTLINGVFSTTSGGTRIFFDEFAAPMIYSSRDQAAGIVPYAVSNRNTVQVVVENRGIRSDPMTVRIAPTAPGIFTANSTGRGNAAALNQNNTINSSTNPAARGSVVVLYITGEGLYRPTPVDGTITQAPLPVAIAPVTVRFGTAAAVVDYAGPAPGLVAGVMQINARIPAAVSGDVPVSIRVGDNFVQTGVTVAVQ